MDSHNSCGADTYNIYSVLKSKPRLQQSTLYTEAFFKDFGNNVLVLTPLLYFFVTLKKQLQLGVVGHGWYAW
ncbi:hypothetical protein CFP56_006479 [Quercus suber]|uniref:Uncharacterized protein n=1 Tax=Quercus suber TaxID=58331 RepID=A0AAW0LA04_QUESU